MYRRNSKYSKSNKLNKDCKKKFSSKFFSQFQQKHVRNCLQKSKEVCKNRESNRTFHCNKENTLINIARIIKQAKVQSYKEKGKEGAIEVGDFCEIYRLLEARLLLVILAILAIVVTQSFQITRKFLKQVEFDRPGERSPEQDCCC